MRKLLVLVLVLGMASLANAGTMSITEVGTGLSEIVATPGQTVHLQLSYDSEDMGGFNTWIDAGGAIITAAAMPSLLDLNATLGGVPRVVDMESGTSTPITSYPIQVLQLDASNDQSGALVAGVLGTFDVTYSGVGTLTINPTLNSAYDVGLLNSILEGTTLMGATITPEPATLAILGLGGLLLRRKK